MISVFISSQISIARIQHGLWDTVKATLMGKSGGGEPGLSSAVGSRPEWLPVGTHWIRDGRHRKGAQESLGDTSVSLGRCCSHSLSNLSSRQMETWRSSGLWVECEDEGITCLQVRNMGLRESPWEAVEPQTQADTSLKGLVKKESR